MKRLKKWLPGSPRQLSLTAKLSVSRQKDLCLFKLSKLLIWPSILSSRSIFLWTYAILFSTSYIWKRNYRKLRMCIFSFTGKFYIIFQISLLSLFISVCVCVYVLSRFSHVWLFPMLRTVLAGYNWSFVSTYLPVLI